MDGKERKLVKRSDKVAFFGNKSDGEETFNRMRGFTTMSGSKNPMEYSRQYVDEEFETTDVVGFSPSIEFGFDQYQNDKVHDEMVEILDNEKTGTDARRNIVTVDFSKPTDDGGYEAVKREYAIIGDADGDSMDAYTYSGTFRATGERIPGVAKMNDDNSVATFTDKKKIISFKIPDSETDLNLGGKTAGELVENLVIKNDNATGTLKYIENWQEFDFSDNSGNFLPLYFEEAKGQPKGTIKCELKGTGAKLQKPVAVDPADGLIIFQIHNNDNTIEITSEGKETRTLKLTDLVLKKQQ